MVIVFLIYVLEGNLQWNSWICKMVDYLKCSIVKFKLNFEKALENKRESLRWGQISSKTLACLGWGNLTIVNNLYIQNIILSKHFDKFWSVFQEWKWIFCCLFWLSVQLEFSVTNLTVTSHMLLHVLPRRNNQVTWPQDVHM